MCGNREGDGGTLHINDSSFPFFYYVGLHVSTCFHGIVTFVLSVTLICGIRVRTELSSMMSRILSELLKKFTLSLSAGPVQPRPPMGGGPLLPGPAHEASQTERRPGRAEFRQGK